MEASPANSSCGSNIVEAYFKKFVSESEVRNRRLYLQKNDVDTIIKPNLTPQQIGILNTAEGSMEVVAADVKTGNCFGVFLRSAGYGYILTGISAMIKKMKLQAGHEIYVSWRDGALHIFCL